MIFGKIPLPNFTTPSVMLRTFRIIVSRPGVEFGTTPAMSAARNQVAPLCLGRGIGRYIRTVGSSVDNHDLNIVCLFTDVC